MFLLMLSYFMAQSTAAVIASDDLETAEDGIPYLPLFYHRYKQQRRLERARLRRLRLLQ